MPTYTNPVGNVVATDGADTIIFNTRPSGTGYVAFVDALGGNDSLLVQFDSPNPYGFEVVDVSDTGTLQVIIAGGASDPRMVVYNVESTDLHGTAHDDEFTLRLGSSVAGLAVQMNGGMGDDRLQFDWSLMSTGLSFDASAATILSDFGTFESFERFWLVAGSGNDTIRTANADDYVVAGAGNDTVVTGGGADSVVGADGADLIDGDDGDDSLLGGNGDDVVYGGDGADQIHGDGDSGPSPVDGSDELYGGSGFDTIFGGGGDDTIEGGADYDELYGGAGSDHLDGGDGNDYIVADDYGAEGDAPDTLIGGLGNDRLRAGFGDSVDGGAGIDELDFDASYGSAGITADFSALTNGGTITVAGANLTGIEYVNSILGTDFNDTIVAGAAPFGIPIYGYGGDDTLTGTAAGDAIAGGQGNDTIHGGVGTDPSEYPSTEMLWGEEGNDTIYIGPAGANASGGIGNDTINGGSGVDDIAGDDGEDRLYGGASNDRLIGGAGDDFLAGGSGQDWLVGGYGNDTFSGTAAEFSGDRIDGFGPGDAIVITDANLSSFTFSVSGETLTYTGGSLAFTSPVAGNLVASAAEGGGVRLSIQMPPLATLDQIADQLVSGFWEGDSHRFNVSQGGSLTVNITGLAAAGQTLAREALALWSDVMGINFVEVASGGQIIFDDNQDGAFSDGIWANGVITSAHVNVSEAWLSDYGTDLNSYSFQTYVHEIGHALGLGHAGNYNEFATYLNEALFLNDAWSTTVMSYFSQQDNLYFGDLGYSLANVATPMVADIAAMQSLYGLSTTTRTGDTTYGFNSNAGRDVFNAAIYPHIAYTIFDSGGVDTLDYSGYGANQLIDLAAGAFSNVGGLTGNVAIALETIIENAIGGSGNDVLQGNSASNSLHGGSGADVLSGGSGTDMLTGGDDGDVFGGTAAELNGDTITDFAIGDRIVISNATLSSFTHSLSGSTLTFSGGSLTLAGGVTGTLVASAAAEGGVQLTLSNNPPPPPPPPAVSRAKLILTEGGQDFAIGGNVAVFGTVAAGEVIEVVRGNILLDASFNRGGDTVVLPGAAGSYTATLSGSIVTISGGDITIAIPVGVVGLAVQFGDSTRTLRVDTESGQAMLGTQAVTSTTQSVEASGPPLVDAAETGPESLARLILTESGQDVDIGGNVTIVGTTASGEVMTILGGTVRLDASFNSGGDTVVLPEDAASYSASLSGSFVTIASGDFSVAIPVGVAGLTVQFRDTAETLRIDTVSGQVMLGDEVVTSSSATVQASAQSNTSMVAEEASKDSDTEYHGMSFEDLTAGADPTFAVDQEWSPAPDYNASIELHRFDFSESFCFG